MRLHVVNFVIRLVVILLHILLTFCKRCCSLMMQAWVNSNVPGVIAAANRSRRTIFLVFLVVAIILYTWPSRLFGEPQTEEDPLHLCMSSHMQSFQERIANFETVVHNPSGTPFLPFVGNGFVGVSGFVEEQILLRRNRSLSFAVPFSPVVEAVVVGFKKQDFYLVDLLSGVVRHIQCYSTGREYLVFQSRLYAHRTRPSVMVQDISIHNPTSSDVTMDLRQTSISSWFGVNPATKNFDTPDNHHIQYITFAGTVSEGSSVGGATVSIATATHKLPSIITVNPRASLAYQVLTVVKYGSKVKDIAALQSEAELEWQSVVQMDSKKLFREHEAAWKQLWLSGFGISRSRAAGALNGDRINVTAYYLLSQSRAPIIEINGVNSSERSLAKQLLRSPDRCYSDHHTLQNAKMWQSVRTSSELSTLVNTWMMTLEKKGCSNLVNAGAQGVLQAVLLSVGGMRFGGGHLEFIMHPSELHRDYHFRRLLYPGVQTAGDTGGGVDLVNVSVVVGGDNRAVLLVAVDRGEQALYACDGGCLDAPVKLSHQQMQLPVKLTDPVTAILYVTSDLEHIRGLKDVIHVREIAEAPAHEHHVIALHKHGHHYGGLPMLFWVSIGLLVVVFHLFLFKLIFNEYCQNGGSGGGVPYRHGRYGI